MTGLQIVLAAVMLALLGAWWWLKQRAGDGGSAADRKEADRIDTVIGWPPQATRVLSTFERVAHGTLMRALPDYMILAQVPLARFLNVPKRNSYADWLRRVGYQCVDFVVCDMAAQVVAVVELQPPQLGERAKKRLTRITRTLKAAQIPLHVWRENALPTADVVREALLARVTLATAPAAARPTTGAATTTPTTAKATTSTATADIDPLAASVAAAAGGLALAPLATASARNPFEDTDRDSTQDEMIELLEPPPSTWFDDLDTDPMPLNKR